MPDTDLIEEFCNYLFSQKRYSENTIKSYKNDLLGLTAYMHSEYEMESLSQVSGQILKSWLSSLKEGNIEARSINRKLSAVKSFFKYLQRQQIILTNPAASVHSMKTGKSLPVFVEEDRLEQVIHRNFFPEGFDGDTRFVIFVLFYHTGMRVSELANLKETDIRFSSEIITIVGKGNKQRNVPIAPGVIGIIKSYIQDKKRLFDTPSENLVVNEHNRPLSRTMIYRIVKQTLSEVTTIQKKSPHVLRHSFATHLSDHGAPINAIKELLGHSSLAATQVYTHTSIARLKEIYKKSHPKS